MVATNLEVTTQLPAPEHRPRGLFVDVAGQLPAEATTYQGHDRLGLGVQHTPWGCEALETGPLNCGGDYLLNGTGPAFDDAATPAIISGNVDEGKSTALNGFPDLVVHPSFKVVDGVTCSVISFPDDTSRNASMVNRLRNRMRTLMSASLAAELVSGWASGGPSLSSTVNDFGGVGDIGELATVLETHLADQLHGNRGVIHVPVQLVWQAFNVGWFVMVNGSIETTTGHRVIADAGYSGAVGPSTPASGDLWAYASGDVFYRVSDTMLLGEGSETWDSETNIRERLAEAHAQLAFDPCPVAAALFLAGS